jgi:hypothetical protein
MKSLNWRFFFVIVLLATRVGGQTPPPPPPIPETWWTPPTKEELDRDFAKRASTIDELLFPLSYYQSKDQIYFETSDSLRAARGLKRTYILFVNGDGESVPSHDYTWYDKSGRPEQTASTQEGSKDSTLHKWKYDDNRRVKCYLTLKYAKLATKGQWSYSGDSVIMKYNLVGQLLELSRYSIRNSGKTRSSEFISKSTFSYNQNGWMILKTVDGVKSSYSYDSKGNPIMITEISLNGQKFNRDSFAWRTGTYYDTVEHWARRSWGSAMLIDQLVINNLTSQESSYTIYPEEKENYIRNVSGPMQINYSFDAGYRLVKRSFSSLDGILRYESIYRYDQDGFASGFQIIVEHDSISDPRPLPAQAQIFTGKIYTAVDVSYTVVNEEVIPSQMDISNTLMGMKGETRELLARGIKRKPWKIVAEFYP